MSTVAKMVLYDWQRGTIPHFKVAPDVKKEDEGSEEEEKKEEVKEEVN